MPVLALALAISTLVQCNVILWVAYLFIYFCSNTNPFLLFSDIDECSTGAFKCRVHTECVNTIGAYTCKCKRGFYSNGPHCLGKNFQVCTCSSQLYLKEGKYKNDFEFFRSSAASATQQYSVVSDFIRMFPMFTSNVFDQI